jgi:hypothetical protein
LKIENRSQKEHLKEEEGGQGEDIKKIYKGEGGCQFSYLEVMKPLSPLFDLKSQL